MKTFSLNQAKQRLRIDRDALDDEVQSQPELFYQVSRARVMANSSRDYARDHVDKTFAEVASNERDDAEG